MTYETPRCRRMSTISAQAFAQRPKNESAGTAHVGVSHRGHAIAEQKTAERFDVLVKHAPPFSDTLPPIPQLMCIEIAKAAR
jgi:hypothetical protein